MSFVRICLICNLIIVVGFSTLANAVSWPTDKSDCIESPFGPRCALSHFHAGWDILYSSSLKAYAVDDGTVVNVYNNAPPFSGYMTTVLVQHTGGYFVGYHDLVDSVTLIAGEDVVEGQEIGTMSDHLHLNYWPAGATVLNSTTLAPGRLLGDNGSIAISIGGTTDICALTVVTEGDIRSAGAGVATCSNCSPYKVYQWDYEGNVRTDYSYDAGGPPLYGDDHCLYSGPLVTDDYGIAPPNSFTCGGAGTNGVAYYFLFPWELHNWIVDSIGYTYVQSGVGSLYFLDRPVLTFLSRATLYEEKGEITVIWEFNEELGEVFSDIYRVFAKKSCNNTQFEYFAEADDLGGGKFSIVDPSPCYGPCYRMVCVEKSSGDVVYTHDSKVKQSVPPAIEVSAVPNPANGSVEISYSATEFHARLVIYDIRGNTVKQFYSLPSGKSEVYWDLRDGNGARVSSGIYFMQLVDDRRVLGRGRFAVIK